jgi:ABC-type transport system substrate-binding protein/ribosomal protein L40E
MLILAGETVAYGPNRAAATSVAIKTYSSTDALIQAVSNGEIDFAPLENVAPQTLQEIKNNPNLNIVSIDNFGFTYIATNLRNTLLNNSAFRQAMLYGFNRDRVLQNVLGGYGETLSPGLFSSAYALLGWRNDSAKAYPYDPAEASQLLETAGYTQSSSGVRIDPSTGQTMRTMFIFSKLSDPAAVEAADLFAQDMRAIGIPVVSLPETDFDFNSLRASYYFDLFIYNQPAGVGPTWLFNMFATANDVYPAPLSTNLVGYLNSTFQRYVGQLMTASSSATAKAAALGCQGELSQDLPVLPVFSRNLLIVESKNGPSIAKVTGSITDSILATLNNLPGGSSVSIGELGGLADIDPAITLTPAESLTLRLITDPLLSRAADGSPQPALINRWESTDNATNLTLTLQPGSQFQDGTPTRAHDLAATLRWLVANAVPSSPFYPILKTVTSITETNDDTIKISLSKPNFFATYEIGDLFALPASNLPDGSGPLALLLNGALKPSGTFTLVRFVQGAEADLKHVSPNGTPTLSGVQGQDLSSSTIGGSVIQIASNPLIYEDQQIDNATFTVHIQGETAVNQLQGSYFGFGIYKASLDLNNQSLSTGNYRVNTQLYAQLPSGALLQFDAQTIAIEPPQLIWQVLLIFLAIGLTAYSIRMLPATLRTGKGTARPRSVASKTTSRYCRKCGAKIGPRAKFCLRCGASVGRRTAK